MSMTCHMLRLREEPLMIWGGGCKSDKKNSMATRPGKKKLNSTTRKKKKTQLKKIKLNCRLARKEKTQLPVGQEKKTQREFSARGPPPRSLMVRPLL